MSWSLATFATYFVVATPTELCKPPVDSWTAVLMARQISVGATIRGCGPAPLRTAAVVLSGFLVFAGFGNEYSDRLVQRAKQSKISPVSIVVAGISVFTILYVALLPTLFQQLMGLADSIKIVLSIILIAPLAFCMGMPFPLGLARVSREVPALVPWAWGINGCASVVSAVLATLLAIEFGFTAVVALAVALYLLAALVWRGAATWLRGAGSAGLPGRGVVGTWWSATARVASGRRMVRPAALRPSKACGLVTSWTRWRSM